MVTETCIRQVAIDNLRQYCSHDILKPAYKSFVNVIPKEFSLLLVVLVLVEIMWSQKGQMVSQYFCKLNVYSSQNSWISPCPRVVLVKKK